MGVLEPLAEGLGGVGGAEALDRIAEEGLPCRLRQDGLRGGLVGVGGVLVRTSSKVCTMCTPSRLPAAPAHFTQRQSSCKVGADHQASWAGARGGEGSVLGVLVRRAENVDLRLWRGCRCLGERARRWRGLGVEDGYGRRGEREGEVDMGRRWRAWWRLGEGEWWYRGPGVVDGYRQQGERGAWRGLWGEGEVDVGRRWRAWRRRGGRERWWRGLGVGVGTAGGGRGGWTLGGSGARGGAWGSGGGGSGVQGGHGGAWGSGSGASGWLRRGGGAGSVGAGGECAVRGGRGSAAVCGTGPHRPVGPVRR